MKSYFIVLILMLLGIICCCQNNQCALLEESNTESFIREFFICRTDVSSFILIDQTDFLSSCEILVDCNKTIAIKQIEYENKNPSIILLYRVDFSKMYRTLYFHRPYSGAAVILKFKVSKNAKKEFILVDETIGSF